MRGSIWRSFVVGLVLGGVLGAFLALILAPWTGREVRDRLSTGAAHTADAVRGAAREVGVAVRTLEERGERYLGRDEEIAWRKVNEIREGVQRYSRTVMS